MSSISSFEKLSRSMRKMKVNKFTILITLTKLKIRKKKLIAYIQCIKKGIIMGRISS